MAEECETPTLSTSPALNHDLLITKMVEDLKKSKVLQLQQVSRTPSVMPVVSATSTRSGDYEEVKQRKLEELKRKLVEEKSVQSARTEEKLV